jgi:sugar phosphate isomerase/epimerase
MDLEDALRHISSMGLRYVELSADAGAHLYCKILDNVPPQRTIGLLEESGLGAAAISIFTDFTVSDAELDSMLGWAAKALAYCRELGAGMLRVFACQLSPYQLRSTYVDKSLIDRAIRNIRRLVPVAEEVGVQLAVENHCAMTATGEALLRLIEGVGSPWFGATYDPGNFVLASAGTLDPVEAGRQIAPYIKHCHLKDPIFVGSGYKGYALVALGTGTMEIPGALQLLHEIGYQGFLSIECENTFDVVRGTREGFAYLRQVMGDYA